MGDIKIYIPFSSVTFWGEASEFAEGYDPLSFIGDPMGLGDVFNDDQVIISQISRIAPVSQGWPYRWMLFATFGRDVIFAQVSAGSRMRSQIG